MSRTKKKVLPKSHPLWKAVREEQANLVARVTRGVPDPRAVTATELSERVVHLMKYGGKLQLRDRNGKLVDVVVPGLE